jgi:hypothetical protein
MCLLQENRTGSVIENKIREKPPTVCYKTTCVLKLAVQMWASSSLRDFLVENN